MKIAYLDCIAGVSGDMMLGAFLDAGFPEKVLREKLATLKLDGFDLRIRKVSKQGLSATKVDVLVSDETTERSLEDIQSILERSALSSSLKDRAWAMFHRLGEIEASIHGIPLEEVRLHELGGIDTIVDVVGALVILEEMGIDEVITSPLPLGRGFVQSAHGRLPLPAPATLALLEGVPVTSSDIEAELVTPTGALLVASLSKGYGQIPGMVIESVGYGAGELDLTAPNLLRVIIGKRGEEMGFTSETLTVLETSIDDLNPEIYDHVISRLFEAGALDVSMIPTTMKKNRPGTLLQVLCRPGEASAMMDILFSETSTLGIREYTVNRHSLARHVLTVDTEYGPVRVKVAQWGDRNVKISPEYEDCRRLAVSNQVPLLKVYQAAQESGKKV